jgi:DNA-binding XRE family transcriptional regulator
MTRVSDQQKPRATDEIARLRSEVTRLRAELRTLKKELDNRAAPAPNRSGADAPDARSLPSLPAPDAGGNYPAAGALRAILARQIIQRRQAAGWTQAELAKRAGVRQETVSRIESGKNAPNVRTVDKLDRALKMAGA